MLEKEAKRGMLTELEEKKTKLKQDALGFKDNRSRLNADASRWAAKRNELNKATKELIDKAQELKQLRDDDNNNVAKAKLKRDEYNEKTNSCCVSNNCSPLVAVGIVVTRSAGRWAQKGISS